MRIISKKTLKDFYEQKEYAHSKTSLEAWHKDAYIGELGHLNRKHLDSLFKNIF